MSEIRALIRSTLLVLFASCLFGCRGASGVPSGGGESELLFPWPDPMPEDLDPRCAAPERRIRAGLRTWDEVTTMVVCLTPRIAPSDVDGFVRRVQAVFENIPPSERRVFPRESLPEAIAELYTAEERETLPPLVSVFADAPARARFESLREDVHWELTPPRRRVCAPWQAADGHAALTEEVLRDALAPKGLRFSPNAVALLRDGAHDPDVFEPANSAAHAETETAPDGRPGAPVATAFRAWQTFVKGQLQRSVAACAQNDLRRALYHLGYGLHAVQDFAARRGRTRAEWAYEESRAGDPGGRPESLTLAREVSAAYLTFALRETPLRDCVLDFERFLGIPFLFTEKVGPLGMKLELTPDELARVAALARSFAAQAQRPEARVRWFGSPEGASPKVCAEDAECSTKLGELFDFLRAP